MARGAGARGPARGSAAAGLLAALLALAAALALLAGAGAEPADGYCSGLEKKSCNADGGCTFAKGWGCLNLYNTPKSAACSMWFYKKPCEKTGCRWGPKPAGADPRNRNKNICQDPDPLNV